MKKTLIALSLVSAVGLANANSMIADTHKNNGLENDIQASEVLKLSADSMSLKQMQSKRYETSDQARLLETAVAVLQDTGFTIGEVEPMLGTVLGSKNRDALEGEQVAANVLLVLVFGISVPVDDHQKLMASVVVDESNQVKGSSIVRVNFSRIVWNTDNQISKAERLEDPEMYQMFYDNFTKGVFLEAHEI